MLGQELLSNRDEHTDKIKLLPDLKQQGEAMLLGWTPDLVGADRVTWVMTDSGKLREGKDQAKETFQSMHLQNEDKN